MRPLRRQRRRTGQSAAGVAKPVLYSLLKTLEQRDEIAKEPLPDGSTGYRLALEAPAEPASAAAAQPVAASA